MQRNTARHTVPRDSLWGEHGKPQQLPAPIAARRRAAREALTTTSAGSTYSDASGVCLRDIRWKYVVNCNELACPEAGQPLPEARPPAS